MVGELVDELDDDVAHLNNLNATSDFDLDAFLQERRQQAPAAGDAGDGKAVTIGSSQGGAVDSSSAPAWVAEPTSVQHQFSAQTTGTERFPPRSCRGGQRTS